MIAIFSMLYLGFVLLTVVAIGVIAAYALFWLAYGLVAAVVSVICGAGLIYRALSGDQP